MAADFLALLVHANLVIGAAVLLVLVLRRPVRGLFGAAAETVPAWTWKQAPA